MSIALNTKDSILTDRAFEWVIECYEQDEADVMDLMLEDNNWARIPDGWIYHNQ